MVHKIERVDFYSGLEANAKTQLETMKRVNRGFQNTFLNDYSSGIIRSPGFHEDCFDVIYNVEKRIFSYSLRHTNNPLVVCLFMNISEPDFWFGSEKPFERTDFYKLMYDYVIGDHQAKFHVFLDEKKGIEVTNFDKRLEDFLNRNLPDFSAVGSRLKSMSFLEKKFG